MDREKKKRRKRRSFNKELKAEAVRLCKVGDRTIAQVARDLDLTETALRDWVKQAEIDATAHAGSSVHGTGIASGPLTTQEREELVRLRRENRVLAMEREILSKATAFFARERR